MDEPEQEVLVSVKATPPFSCIFSVVKRRVAENGMHFVIESKRESAGRKCPPLVCSKTAFCGTK